MTSPSGGMSKPNSNVESAFLSAVYRACVKLHNGTLDETGQIRLNTTAQTEEVTDTDFGAIMYISAVLLFYSTGIIIMIVKYLKTEKAEMEEELALERFFKHMPTNRIDKENHVNKVAIRAFHTLTSAGHGRVGRREVTNDGLLPRYTIMETNSTVVSVDENDPKTLLVTDV